ncbi:MAG: hypothetical protein EPO31_02045 [Gammaproteobacteria bacterium]|jgi:hypothetical protein|nr:MAG: hypothetical protein EPO31_02045 [Gammaproteobacteria bacterium]
MKIRATATILSLIMLCISSSVFAADIAGSWTAEFDSQVGKQKYTYVFTVTGTSITGEASVNIAGTDSKSKIAEGTVDGDNVTFVENLNYGGQDLRITYTGTVAGDDLNLKRDVAGQGGETFTAKRVK